MKQTPTFVIGPVGIKVKQMFLSNDSQWGRWVSASMYGGSEDLEVESVG